MGEQLYNLINSQVFQIVAVIWLIILIVWKEKWSAVLGRTVNLLKKPLVFRKDPHPENVPLYPRELLEDSSNSFRKALTEPLVGVIRVLHGWLSNIVKTVHNPNHPRRTLGSIFFFAAFLLLVYADAVAIANTLYVLQISTSIPPLLAYFDIAVFAGSLLALILGFAFVLEARSSDSEITSISDRDPNTKRSYVALALLVSVLSVISLVAWGLARFVDIEAINNTFLDRFVTFVQVFIVPLNSAFAAAMIFTEFFRGLSVILAGLGYIIEGILYVINYLLTLLSSLLPFLFDILYRIIHILVDILQWIITTPILAVFWPFQKIYESLSKSDEDTEDKQKKNKVGQDKSKNG